MEEEIRKVQCRIAELKREERQLINKIKKMSEVTERVDQEKLKLINILTAHRLNGLTVLKETDNILIIRLDCDYLGKYEDCYMFELHKDEDKWSIVKDNLPYFLPLPRECKSAEPDPRTILNACQEFVKSYVARKGQVQEAMKTFPHVIFEHSRSYDFVTIAFETGSMKDVRVYLEYGVYYELPKTTQFTAKGSEIR
ncbi:hypothetical protein CHUAL_004590 [Chamberlinius hualienensis]